MAFHGTIKLQPYFNAYLAVDELHKAMKGIGCDKDKVISIIVSINNAQRQQLLHPYHSKYGKDLIHELKRELIGDFEDVILGLMEIPAKFEAIMLRKAMKGLGTRESALIDILCARTNHEITAIKNEYNIEFGRFLETDISGDTSGDFQTLLLALTEAKRDPSYNVDLNKAREDARRLKESNDKSLFRDIFTQENFGQLQLMCKEYAGVNGEPIEETIERLFGDDKDAMKAYRHIAQCMLDRTRCYAEQLYRAMKGLGTKDSELIRIIVSRSEIDLADIRDEFQRLYNNSLVSWIKKDCSGAYKHALVAIVNGN